MNTIVTVIYCPRCGMPVFPVPKDGVVEHCYFCNNEGCRTKEERWAVARARAGDPEFLLRMLDSVPLQEQTCFFNTFLACFGLENYEENLPSMVPNLDAPALEKPFSIGDCPIFFPPQKTRCF